MVYRVVSTKLNEEEHSKLIDFCNGKGCTPSAFLRESINERINSEKPKETGIHEPKEEPKSREMPIEELAEKLGVNKVPKDKPLKIEIEKPKPSLEETLDHMKNCKNQDCKFGRMNILKNLQ